MNANRKIAYVPWWRPVRLAMPVQAGKGNIKFIGWVWRARAHMVNNIHHGWIAFVDDQTPERLACCPVCDRPMDASRARMALDFPEPRISDAMRPHWEAMARERMLGPTPEPYHTNPPPPAGVRKPAPPPAPPPASNDRVRS